jgi:hypothetical protein
MVALASSRGGSNRGSTPTKFHGPSPSARATPNERKPRAANPLTAASTSVFTCDALADSSRITWGAPLVTLNEDPSAAVTVASVHLRTASNGWNLTTW